MTNRDDLFRDFQARLHQIDHPRRCRRYAILAFFAGVCFGVLLREALT